MHRSIKSVIFFLFIALGTISAHAQYKWAVGATYLPGFLFGHRDDSRNLEAHTQGFELSIAHLNHKNKNWSTYFKNAEVGYEFIYLDLGHPNLLGKAYGLGANFQFRIAGHKTNHLALRLGSGVGYITRIFDVETNRHNMAIGSHWNGNIQIALLYKTQLSPKYSLKTGLGITHYSNGSIHTPNLGINVPSLFIGLQSGVIKIGLKADDTSLIKKTKLTRHEIMANYAYKEKFFANPRIFHIFNVGYRWNKPINPVRRWYLGADLVWDPTHPYSYYLSDPNPRVGIDNSTELGVLIGHRYDIGKFSLVSDIGFYILNPYQTKYFTYQRLGFRYAISKKLFINSTLKIHFGTADYFEWGLGYSFNKFKK